MKADSSLLNIVPRLIDALRHELHQYGEMLALLDRQQEIGQALRKPEAAAFADLMPLLPEKFRPAVEALVRENNELLVRVQQRARQNHLLLSRSVELMQRFMHALIPASQPTTYNGAGSVDGGLPQTQPLYEAVG